MQKSDAVKRSAGSDAHRLRDYVFFLLNAPSD
jgi:hypothetical protein